MSRKPYTKIVHEGDYVAQGDVEAASKQGRIYKLTRIAG